MSRNIRQTALSGILGSKRIIVAVCAAIAMVLGAMSVGASIFVPQSSAENGKQAANAPIFTERTSGGSTSPEENGGIFTNQHALVPGSLQPPQTNTPQAATVKPKVTVGIEFGPVNVNAGLSLGGLQVKIDASTLAPTIEPAVPTPTSDDPTTPTDTPPADDSPKEDTPVTDPTLPPEDPNPQPMGLVPSDATSPDNPPLN